MSLLNPNTPGVKINELRLGAPPIFGVGTSTAGFVGVAPKSDRFVGAARLVTSADQFTSDYIFAAPGDETRDKTKDATRSTDLSRAVLGFFANGGGTCYVVNVDSTNAAQLVNNVNAGLALFQVIDEIAIIAAPGQTDPAVYTTLEDQAKTSRNRFAILDPPAKVANLSTLITPSTIPNPTARPGDSIHAAFYYPRILVGPQVAGGKLLSGDPRSEAASPSGHVAGVYARVDASRGVHKAPANEQVLGALGVEHLLTDEDQNAVNKQGVNLLRMFSGNTVIWGGRTLQANGNSIDPDYAYVSTRRLVSFVEESLRQGLRFAVFEPNNLSLRQQIIRSARGFLNGVWRDGALFGATADEAFYVRFPDIFNTDADRAAGKLTVEIGLRVTFPAEFIIVRIGVILENATTA